MYQRRRSDEGVRICEPKKKIQICNRTEKKHKESRVGLRGAIITSMNRRVCNVCGNVVRSQCPTINLAESDPFQAVADLLITDGTEDPYVWRRSIWGYETGEYKHSSSIRYLRRRPSVVPWR